MFAAIAALLAYQSSDWRNSKQARERARTRLEQMPDHVMTAGISAAFSEEALRFVRLFDKVATGPGAPPVIWSFICLVGTRRVGGSRESLGTPSVICCWVLSVSRTLKIVWLAVRLGIRLTTIRPSHTGRNKNSCAEFRCYLWRVGFGTANSTRMVWELVWTSFFNRPARHRQFTMTTARSSTFFGSRLSTRR
jgi:hypothetical protein